MTSNPEPSSYKTLAGVIVALVAGVVGFLSVREVNPGEILVGFLNRSEALAAEPESGKGTACTKPCCAGGETSSTPEDKEPCCDKCAVKAVSEGAGVEKPGGGEGQKPCCDKCAAKTAGAETETCSIAVPGDWTAAKIEEFRAKGDWCLEHAVPESMCVKCNRALEESFKAKGDWCGGHGLPESLCVLCHPDLAKLGLGRDWCEKHGLPASQCVYCRADQGAPSEMEESSLEAIVERNAAALSMEARAPDLAVSDPEHRAGLNPNCPLHSLTIRLASDKVAEEAGLVFEKIERRPMTQTIGCYGEVQYDRSRYALLSPRAPGIVQAVTADLGRKLSKGEILALVDSMEFGKAKADLLRAQAEANRWKWVAESLESGAPSGAVARRDLIEGRAEHERAQVELAIARQALKNFGLSDGDIEAVISERNTDSLLPVRAPFDSTVVELAAVPGELAQPGKQLFAVADLSTLWLCLDLFVEDANQVCLGLPVTFAVDRLDGEVFSGKVTWIGAELDPKTRTTRVRAELDNSEGLLRAGMFGKGDIRIHSGEEVVAIPKEAVQWDGCCNLVFVRKDPLTIEPRKVRLGPERDGFVVARAGLLPGEEVVTRGSYLMKTEVLKSKIGAGCCAADSPASGAREAKENPKIAEADR
ncbi:MAG: efflux RND transporter periplasmic adaptor subunit [Candidatus Omnitrophica bacterium]|nr:efflux RND transporter periplasmic adaptor subunit [Candidatus Omnitrophota bacterium]